MKCHLSFNFIDIFRATEPKMQQALFNLKQKDIFYKKEGLNERKQKQVKRWSKI